MKRLIWTRDAADWQRDEHLFAETTMPRILRLPCIKLRALAPPTPPLTFTDAVITSRSAIALAPPGLRASLGNVERLWTHGATTAELARAKGLPVLHVPEARTAAELCAVLEKRLPPTARVLCPGPKASAFPMAEKLAAKGFETLAVDVYETLCEPQTPDGQTLAREECTAMRPNLAGVACFASPSAITGFVKGFPPSPADDLYERLIAVSIGPTTSQAAKSYFPLIHEARKASNLELARLAMSLLQDD